jgi:hypothetical protein
MKLLSVTYGNRSRRTPRPSTAKRLLIPEILFPEEHAELLRWATESSAQLKQVAPGRYAAPMAHLKRPDVCRRVRLRIQEQLDLDLVATPSGALGLYLSVLSENGTVLPFIEPASDGMKYIRCVLLLQAATSGGQSFVGNGVVPMNERDLLIFCSSTFHQGVTVVEGRVPRISLELGYEVSAAHVVPGLDELN